MDGVLHCRAGGTETAVSFSNNLRGCPLPLQVKKVGKHTAAVLDKIRKDIKDLQSKTREDKKKDRQAQLLDVSAGEREVQGVE